MLFKIKKILFSTVIISLFSSFIVFGSKEGMGSIGGGDTSKEQMWTYTQEDGTYLKNQWKQMWDNWYYFGEDGISKQNTWAEIDGNWYYFNQWSVMLHDTTTPDGYTVGPDGAWTKDGQVVIETDTSTAANN